MYIYMRNFISFLTNSLLVYMVVVIIHYFIQSPKLFYCSTLILLGKKNQVKKVSLRTSVPTLFYDLLTHEFYKQHFLAFNLFF